METSSDPVAASMRPRSDEIRKALGRILAVNPFHDSPQLSAFLKFVVEETLLGKGRELKGYTIATLALGRKGDFDPQTDPIVRVQAGRVRHALKEYYEANPEDPIRIQFVKGSYEPLFQFNDKAFFKSSSQLDLKVDAPQVASEPISNAQLATIKRPLKKRFRKQQHAILGLATIVAMLGIVALSLLGALVPRVDKRTPAVHLSQFPTVTVDTIAGPSDSTELISVIQRTQDALTRFDDIILVRDSQDERGSSQLDAVRNKAERMVLRITGHYVDRDSIRFSARLIEQFDQRIVWAKEFEPVLSGSAGDKGRSEIIRTIATTIARPYGVVHAYARQVFGNTNQIQSDFGCIMTSFDYWQNNNKEMRTTAKQCLENQLAKNSKLGALHSQLAYLHLDDVIIDNLEHLKAPLDRAIASAIRGANLAPTSARSYQTLMAVHFARREMESSWQAADQALKLNPFDTDIMADVAVHYVKAGQYEKGLALLNESLLFNNSPPDWVLTYRALALYMLGRHDEAAIAITPIKTSEFPFGLMGTILASFHEKDQYGAIEKINMFKKRYPEIHANPKAYFERINLERGMMNFILARYQVVLTWAGQSN